MRDEPTVIFDFHQYFYPALEKYMYGHGPKPSTEVLVSFGQRFQPEKDSVSSLLISATLVHSYACHLLTTVCIVVYKTFFIKNSTLICLISTKDFFIRFKNLDSFTSFGLKKSIDDRERN